MDSDDNIPEYIHSLDVTHVQKTNVTSKLFPVSGMHG